MVPVISMLAQARRRRTTRLHRAVAHYRDASRSLHTPASWQSRYGLDWTNFFIADAQTAFGTFVAFYLAHLGWSRGDVGLVLTVGGIAAMVGQIPGGALVDIVTWKRSLVAAGIIMTSAAALILALAPSFVMVLAASLLQGATGGIMTPAIAGISLGLVGRRAMPVRTGRNLRYAAGGHAITAGLMGVAGAYFSDSAIFIAAASLGIPALIALNFIRPNEIDYRRARNAAKANDARPARIIDLTRNHRLVLFTAALGLFQLADASMLPLIGENVAATVKSQAPIWISILIIIPQIVVAILAPWVGYHSEKRGRRPLLLTGFALEPLRAVLLAFASGFPFLIAAQLLNGITGAMIGVLTVMVITDLTAGTGRFNLAQGVVGAISGFAASVSTLATGYLAQAFGPTAGFLAITAVASGATALIWIFISETKPTHDDDD
jgi:MFS family permease